MAHYKELDVWKKSIMLVKSVYEVTEKFPAREQYGLTSQLRRASVSIPSNIAEGHSRKSTKDFIRFLTMSYGSLSEVETQLIIAKELSFLNKDELKLVEEKSAEIGRMLNGLMNSLKSRADNYAPGSGLSEETELYICN